MKIQNLTQAIGNTPHLRLGKIFPSHQVWTKLERNNPGGSIKDRIALSMIEDAEKKGLITPGKSVIVEPTSGNTGIGLALVAAIKGYSLKLVMPDTMSVERRKLMSAYGAEIVLTPGADGMKGAIAKAQEIVANTPDAWLPLQFDNQANPAIHRTATANEILADFPEGIDYLITGVGTGGHITGVAETLKAKFPNLKVFAVEPEPSQVIAGNLPGKHRIQGIGAGFVPSVLNTKILDGTIPVTNDEAFEYTRRAAKEEGLLLGISSGASLAAVAKKIAEIEPGKTILTFTYDTGERYLSIEDLFIYNA